MKNLFYYILLFSVIIFTGCKNDVDDIFGELPTERVTKEIAELQETLKSSTGGWQVTYFTDPDYYGAYNFLMRFDGKNVIMQGDELFTEGEHTSLYSVTPIQGPTLNFDTYTIISQLADPMLYEYGSGLRGDNEFVWHATSANKDTIYFRAKKSRSEVKFVKFNRDWNEYFNNIQLMTNNFSKGEMDRFFKQLTMEDTGTQILLNGYDATKRTMNPLFPYKDQHGQDSIVQIVNGVGVTENGISFYYPMEVDGKNVQNLAYNEALTRFDVSDPGVNGYVTSVREPDFLFVDANLKVLNTGVDYRVSSSCAEINTLIKDMNEKLRNGADITMYRGSIYFYAPQVGSGHSIHILYVFEGYLYSAASVRIPYSKSTQRSDKITIRRPSGTAIPVEGDYADLVREEMEQLVRLISNDNSRTGADYIVIPQEDGSYMLGGCDANIFFSLLEW